MTEKLLDSFVQISTNLKNFIEEHELYVYHSKVDYIEDDHEEFTAYIKQNLINNDYVAVIDSVDDCEMFFGDKQKIEKLLNNCRLNYAFIFNIKKDKAVSYTTKVTVDD